MKAWNSWSSDCRTQGSEHLQTVHGKIAHCLRHVRMFSMQEVSSVTAESMLVVRRPWLVPTRSVGSSLLHRLYQSQSRT
jgi:hypothetical protein